MSTYPGSVDQDDVLGQGHVESSAFGHGEDAHREEDLHAGVGNEKRKRNPLWLWVMGGLGLVAVLAVAAALVLGGNGSDTADASFTQVAPAAPQPRMDAATRAGATDVAPAPAPSPQPVAAEDPINGGDPAMIGPGALPETPATPAVATAATSASTVVATTIPTDASPGAASAVSAQPSSKPQPTPPAAAATPPPAVQKSDSERLQELEERYEALSGDYARLNEKFQLATAVAEKRRAGARGVASRPTASAPVAAKVTGVQLKAVVDNNAWVQTEAGDSVMVSPGDEIPGVGQVRSVDPETGTVRLADGRVIR